MGVEKLVFITELVITPATYLCSSLPSDGGCDVHSRLTKLCSQFKWPSLASTAAVTLAWQSPCVINIHGEMLPAQPLKRLESCTGKNVMWFCMENILVKRHLIGNSFSFSSNNVWERLRLRLSPQRCKLIFKTGHIPQHRELSGVTLQPSESISIPPGNYTFKWYPKVKSCSCLINLNTTFYAWKTRQNGYSRLSDKESATCSVY